MSGNEKQPLVPRLRFPEFREAEEWKNKTLADVCLRITNGKANAEDHEEDGVYPLFDRSEVIKKSSDFAFDDEAVIIPGEGMRFQPKYFQGKFNLHQRAYALMKHKGYAKFVYYTLDRFKDVLAKNAVKSTVLSLRLPIIERFCLTIPSKDEQQKIADCLSSLDELIAAETQKLDTLKTHKKSLMQQLFPSEGETVPRLRFPEFRGAGEWEERALFHYIASLDAGVSVNSGDRSACDNEIGVLKTSCVSDGNFDATENKVVQEPVEIARVKEPVCANTIIISRMNTIALVGANAFIEKDIPNLFLPDRLWAAKSTGRGNMRFLAYILGSEGGRAALSGLASGSSGTMKNIGKSEVLALQVTAPTIAEQEHISDCLSSLDDLITTQSQKIDTLKTHKKGLMQQLFPALDEVPA